MGSNAKYPCDYPFLIGALSRNPVVDKYWDSFAVGAALCGIPLVIGENVGGGDNKTEFNPDGSIRALPDLDRRIAVYRRYYNGKGALFVQLNANDAYNGVADYVARKYGDFVCVEIKWGQGAKPINGEGLIRDLDYARFMKSRSYCLRPIPRIRPYRRPSAPGRVKHFTRYTGLTYPALSTPEEVLRRSRGQGGTAPGQRRGTAGAEDRGVRDARSGCGDTGGLRAGFRTPDHRRLRRRNGHEPQRHAGQLGCPLRPAARQSA